MSTFLRKTVDLVAVTALLCVGVIGFAPLYVGTSWWLAAGGALVVGIGIGLGAHFGRWPVAFQALAVVAAYFLAGGPLVFASTTTSGVLPTLATLRALAHGVVTSWKALLTVQVPIEGVELALLVPFITALVCGALAVVLALRAKGQAWALVPAAAVMVVSISFGTYKAVAPTAQALVFVGTAVAWIAFRRAQGTVGAAAAAGHGRGAGPRRVLAAAGVLGVSLAGGVWLGDLVAQPEGRAVLRDEVVPPLELHAYTSPLQSYRKWVRDYKDQTLLTVEGAPENARVRLATLDSYNGIVYAVSGDGSSVAGSFERVGSVIPTDVEGKGSTVSVTIGALTGVWLPTVGEPHVVTFGGADADSTAKSLHYNRATQTAVVTAGLAEGVSYTMDVVVPTQPTDEQLAGAAFAQLPLPRVEGVPDGLRGLAADSIATATTPQEQVVALVDTLAGAGYYSHGLEGEAPSRSGHGSERIAELVGDEQMIGDDEQYAVAFALMAYELGIPARVVMGFQAPADATGTWTLTGADVHVWAEVDYEGFGWVPVVPVPEADRTPTNEETPPQREPKPQVLQPPPPPQEPAQAPPAVPVDDEAVVDKPDVLGSVVHYLVIAGAGIGVLAVFLGPALAVLIVKARRRRRRRKASVVIDRVAGGWNEIADTAADYGVVLPPPATRVEKGLLVDAALANVETLALARRADRHIWGPDGVDADDAAAYWRDVTATIAAIHHTRTRRKRAAARLSLRSLVRTQSRTQNRARKGT